jgi:hypothetical protein
MYVLVLVPVDSIDGLTAKSSIAPTSFCQYSILMQKMTGHQKRRDRCNTLV